MQRIPIICSVILLCNKPYSNSFWLKIYLNGNHFSYIWYYLQIIKVNYLVLQTYRHIKTNAVYSALCNTLHVMLYVALCFFICYAGIFVSVQRPSLNKGLNKKDPSYLRTNNKQIFLERNFQVNKDYDCEASWNLCTSRINLLFIAPNWQQSSVDASHPNEWRNLQKIALYCRAFLQI